jgi:amino acid transporter
MIQKRNIPIFVVLHLVTCGLFGLYWMVCLTDDIDMAAGTEGISGTLSAILNICTFGMYGLYWSFQCGEKLDRAKQRRGIAADNGGILYLILYIFGGLVAYALIQNELNKIADN